MPPSAPKPKRKKKAKKKRKSPRKSLVRACDKAFSEYMRALAKMVTGSAQCFFCGTEPIECVFHWITRSKYSVRWDPHNIAASCSGCNLRYEYDPHPFIQWFIRKNGQETYEELIRKSHQKRKFSRTDLEEMADDFSARYRELQQMGYYASEN